MLVNALSNERGELVKSIPDEEVATAARSAGARHPSQTEEPDRLWNWIDTCSIRVRQFVIDISWAIEWETMVQEVLWLFLTNQT